MFTLYTTGYSSNGRKPLALSKELGLEPEVVDVDVYRGRGRDPAYLAINPLGKVPALVDGSLHLWESNAILQYIAEAYGEYRYWSREPTRRADIARWLFWESAHFQPALTAVLRQHAGHVMVPARIAKPVGEPDWNAEILRPLMQYLESHLRENAYLAGSELTLADFSVTAMTIYLERLRFPFDEYPAFTDWYLRMHALPGFRHTNLEPWTTSLPARRPRP